MSDTSAIELLTSCKDLRSALAGALRVMTTHTDVEALVDAFVAEMARIGISEGFGVRADEAIANVVEFAASQEAEIARLREQSNDDGRIMIQLSDRVGELETEIAARQWQPIETAPKDGTNILLFAEGYIEPFVGSYVCFDGPAPDGYRDGWCNEWDGDYLDEEPTHWQPLPEPPLTDRVSSSPQKREQEER